MKRLVLAFTAVAILGLCSADYASAGCCGRGLPGQPARRVARLAVRAALIPLRIVRRGVSRVAGGYEVVEVVESGNCDGNACSK